MVVLREKEPPFFGVRSTFISFGRWDQLLKHWLSVLGWSVWFILWFPRELTAVSELLRWPHVWNGLPQQELGPGRELGELYCNSTQTSLTRTHVIGVFSMGPPNLKIRNWVLGSDSRKQKGGLGAGDHWGHLGLSHVGDCLHVPQNCPTRGQGIWGAYPLIPSLTDGTFPGSWVSPQY
jgi:hypothetical protein